MASNISGGGFLSGLGSFTTAVTNAFTLLASKILGYTSVTSVPVQKNSLIMHGGYVSALVSKRETPLAWEEKSKQIAIITTNGTSYLCTSYSNGYKMYFSEDMDTFEEATFPILNPYTSQNDILGPYFYDENNQYNIYAGIPHGSGFYITGGLVNGTSQYFKSKKGISSLQEFNIPTDAKNMTYHGTVGDSSYFSFYIGTNYTDRKFYKTSKIELSGNTPVTYTEIDLTVNGVKYRPDGDVYYANGMYAVTGQRTSGSGGYVYVLFTSSDGITFTTNNGGNDYIHLNLVNNTFVYGQINDGEPIVILSATTDFQTGETINLFKPEGTTSFGLSNGAVVNNKLYVPFYSTSFFAVSEDGINWTTEDAGVNIQFDYMLTAGTVTVNVPLAGGSSYYTTLVDGTGPGAILSSAYGGSFSLSQNTMGSFDGSSIPEMTPVSIGGGSSTGYLTPGIGAYGNGIYLGSDGNYTLHISTDNGKNWSQVSSAPGATVGLAYGNGVFVRLLQQNQAIEYSTDGVNWSATNISSSNISKLHYSSPQGKFVGIETYATSPQIVTSTDGITWSTKTGALSDPSNRTFGLMDVASNDSDMCALVVDLTTNLRYFAYTFDDFDSVVGVSALPTSIYTDRLTAAGGTWVAYGARDIATSASGGSIWSVILDDATLSALPYSTYIQNAGYDGKNLIIIGNNLLAVAYTNTFNNPLTDVKIFTEQKFRTDFANLIIGQVGSMVETQVSIGDQGSGTAEVLTPVTLYKTAPFGQGTSENPESALITKITLKNLSSYPVSVDIARFGVFYGGSVMSSDTVQVNDQIIQPNQTFTYEPSSQNGILYADMSFVVLPSSVDAIEAKIYTSN